MGGDDQIFWKDKKIKNFIEIEETYIHSDDYDRSSRITQIKKN